MSWFDASGFASLAKSALKEAQKTIDKALDITEEDASKAHNGELFFFLFMIFFFFLQAGMIKTY